MKLVFRSSTTVLALAFLAGCAPPLEADREGARERLGAATSALEGMNALGMNALGVNALQTLKDPGVTGDLFRELVRYTVGCALLPPQTFSFSWTDGNGTVHDESYPGALGLVTSWADRPLDATGQHLVSACLAARTNYYQVPVTISLRSPCAALADHTTEAELESYPHVEGAFWGNLFAATPYLNACYLGSDVARSRAAQRDCATGHLEADGTVVPCGMIALRGPCGSVCGQLQDDKGYYPSCLDQPQSGSPARTALAITVGLP